VYDTTTAALFAISIADFPPKERVPTIVNLKFLTDMGRMSGESLSDAKTTCLQVLIAVASGPPPCTA
jgi:hypothetical protein